MLIESAPSKREPCEVQHGLNVTSLIPSLVSTYCHGNIDIIAEIACQTKKIFLRSIKTPIIKIDNFTIGYFNC